MKKYAADPDRLCRAIERVGLALRRPRQNRLELLEHFVGTRYSEQGASLAQPLNMLSLYVDVVSRQLVAKAPRAMLSTFIQQYKPIVAAEQTWLNRHIQKTNMAALFQRSTLDALFAIGVVNVGIATPAQSASFGWEVEAGEPFAETTDLDDFVFDMHARTWDQVEFIGKKVRLPLNVVKEDKNYTRQRKKLTADTDPIYNKLGVQYVSVIGRTIYQSSEEEFQDHVTLWEIYCPQHRCVYTFVDDNGCPGLCEDGEPLREQDWIGPSRGPYHILGYGIVPGNLMPKAPLQDLFILHKFINRLYRKLMDQSERQKTITAIRRAADADGNRQIQAMDGEAIGVDDPQSAKEIQMGGPDQKNFAMFVDAVQRFNYVAGNIESAGGLGPQSKTATQDKMLEASASGAVLSKQDATLNHVSEVMDSLLWFHHHHPTKKMSAPYTIPGMPDMPTAMRTVTPEQRGSVPWEEMEVKVDPHSMQHSTPEKRAKDLTEVVTQIIAPMMQSLQQRGIMLDPGVFLKKLGEYRDMPDMAEILTLQDPPQDPAAGSGGADSPGKPPSTTRNYGRDSTSEATQGGQANMAAQMMGAAKSQDGTMAGA